METKKNNVHKVQSAWCGNIQRVTELEHGSSGKYLGELAWHIVVSTKVWGKEE